MQSRVSLLEGGRAGFETHTEERAVPTWSGGDVTTQACKSGGTGPQPRTAGSPRSWERQEGASPAASRGSTALPTPRFQPSDTDSRLLASRTMREYISTVLPYQICGNLVSSHRKLMMFLKIKTKPAIADRGWELPARDRSGLLEE